MDTNSLIIWVNGAILIAIGLAVYFLAMYFEATEANRKNRVRDLKIVAILSMLVGALIYIIVLITLLVA